jgi:hypothetical protein
MRLRIPEYLSAVLETERARLDRTGMERLSPFGAVF